MRSRSLIAGLMLAILLVVSLGGVVCETDCSTVMAVQSTHPCCSHDHDGSQQGFHNQDACSHPAPVQPGVVTIPAFVAPDMAFVAQLPLERLVATSTTRAVPASASPPIFPLRI